MCRMRYGNKGLRLIKRMSSTDATETSNLVTFLRAGGKLCMMDDDGRGMFPRRWSSKNEKPPSVEVGQSSGHSVAKTSHRCEKKGLLGQCTCYIPITLKRFFLGVVKATAKGGRQWVCLFRIDLEVFFPLPGWLTFPRTNESRKGGSFVHVNSKDGFRGIGMFCQRGEFPGISRFAWCFAFFFVVVRFWDGLFVGLRGFFVVSLKVFR